MIVITGAAGFIGGNMVRHLNESGRQDLVLVDDFTTMPVETCHGASLQREEVILPEDVEPQASLITNTVETCHGASLQNVKYLERIPRDFFYDWLEHNHSKVDFIIHLGTEIETLPKDTTCFQEQLLEFSQRLWSFAAMNRIPLLYAASSVDNGWYFLENEKIVYERLKRQFDQWVLKQRITPPLWAGFAMPEVYGPYESRTGRASSSVFQAYQQLRMTGSIEIPQFVQTDGTMLESFCDRIFVKDVVTVFTWFMNHLPASGFYFLGTGFPRPMSAVAAALFSATKLPLNLRYSTLSLPAPNRQQSGNQVVLSRLSMVGYKKKMTPLEKGIRLYVKNYLEKSSF